MIKDFQQQHYGQPPEIHHVLRKDCRLHVSQGHSDDFPVKVSSITTRVANCVRAIHAHIMTIIILTLKIHDTHDRDLRS